MNLRSSSKKHWIDRAKVCLHYLYCDNLSYFSGRTTIIIAHRLTTIRNAHRIYVLENGSVIEEGDHKTLMAQEDSYYRSMVINQTSSESDHGISDEPGQFAAIQHEKNDQCMFRFSGGIH